MAPITTPNEHRCPSCTAVLVHAGAICVICDEGAHYEAPIRTSPPLRLPVGGDGEAVDDDAPVEDGIAQAV